MKKTLTVCQKHTAKKGLSFIEAKLKSLNLHKKTF